ncbi:hypothetical protein BEH94_06570 [Candidatus Altiarchaeales archaeon WOR_SM1_SCG]|nr:hypothetical protein BEH94_06570 [Candidatus Altiarchaeales archaeon WOR_SM1_SCG]
METDKCFLEETGMCPVEETANLIGKKWVILILRELLAGTRRFNELLRSLKEISPGVLSNRLNEMKKCGIIQRKVYAKVPLRVEYSLTEKGLDLKDTVVSMVEWWMKWK